MQEEPTMTRLLGVFDTLLHRAFDGYINRQWWGWGWLQVAQWHVCNAYENRR